MRLTGALSCSAAIVLAVAACDAGAPGGTASPSSDATAPSASTTPSADASASPSTLPVDGTERAGPDELVWAQEFDGPAGEGVDRDVWLIDEGLEPVPEPTTAWSARPDNLALTGDGALRLAAVEEEWTGPDGRSSQFTSARIETVDAFRYGRIEARIRVDVGTGTLTAFWMLGRYEHAAENWPLAGEIDIVEFMDGADAIHGTVHGGTRIDGHWQQGGTLEAEDVAGPGSTWAGGWHVYAVEWEPESIAFAVDGNEYYRITPADLAEDQRWTFDEPEHILLTLAVGEHWASTPDPADFPAEMLVDYIRVYGSEQHPRLEPSPSPSADG
mgnify:CR=1 FL=1